MTFSRYLEGILFIGLAVVPIGAASYVWRKCVLPNWSGAVARITEIIIGLSALIFVSELLGSINLFRVGAVVPSLFLVGTAGWFVATRTTARPHEPTIIPDPKKAIVGCNPPAANLTAIAAVSVVAADWVARTADAYHHGMTTIDTLWYHMPFAARFVQEGSLTPLHYVDSGALTVFYPANSELVHALGIMFLGNDLLSPMANLGWLAIALLAGWCVGRPFGVAPVTLSGVAILMATTGLVATQPGGAYDDVVGIALLLCCVAILVNIEASDEASRLPGIFIASLAAGLAIGTKVTFLAPIGALTIGVWVVARRGRRLVEGSLWFFGLVSTGVFWYLRNVIKVGNPLPTLNIRVGPVALPSPTVPTPDSLARFLLHGSAWRQYLLPGLRLSFGPAWWALLGLAASGMALGAVVGRVRVPRMLAWVGVATAAIYLVTPQYLAILGAPVFFVDNVRYADAAIVLGLVLLPLVPILLVNNRRWLLLGAYVAVLAGTQLDGTIWPIAVFADRFAMPIKGVDSFVGLLSGVIVFGFGIAIYAWRRSSRQVRLPILAVVGMTVGIVVIGFGLQQSYLRNRYKEPNPGPNFSILDNIGGSRIAVVGATLQLQYELYGRDLSNYVQYVGQSAPHSGYSPITTCSQWRRTLNVGHYKYVVASTGFVTQRRLVFTTPFSFTVWTGTDPAATLVAREVRTSPGFTGNTEYVGYSLFRLHGRLDPSSCSSAVVVPTQP